MSDVTRALEQIAEIHAQLGRSRVYRGWRSAPVAGTGIVGLAAAAWQAGANVPVDPWTFTVYWLSIASAALLLGCSEIAWHYLFRSGDVERAYARHVVGQLLPALVAGALVTAAFIKLDLSLVRLLPGLWALFFGVAVFATRPDLPRASGWVALYYWTMGLGLLWWSNSGALSPWSVGGTFGVGQLFTAVVLYVDLERPGRGASGNLIFSKGDDDDTKA